MKEQKPIQFATVGSKTWVKEFKEALKNPDFIYTKPENIKEPNSNHYRSKTEYENALRFFITVNSI